jgi:superfamily II DNA or RNA helicase
LNSGLRGLFLPATLNTSEHHLIRDFFAPALAAATQYDRGVGYFSSGWLRAAASALGPFIAGGGRARWVTSPILAVDDWEALKRAGSLQAENHLLERAMLRNLAALTHQLESDTLNLLSWLVADGIVDFRLALPRNRLDQGDFHDKFGILYDDSGNRISFSGSYNDSIQGNRNYESIKVFTSWDETLVHFVDDDTSRFQTLWNNQDPNVMVYTISEAVYSGILQLRDRDRPYQRPEPLGLLPSDLVIQKKLTPYLPPMLTLRDYQKEAVSAWEVERRGILEMATGTGKTLTALTAAVRHFNEKGRMVLLVLCPVTHLIDQWAQEAQQFGFMPIRVVDSKERWSPQVAQGVRAFRKGHSKCLTIIATNAALQRGELMMLLQPVLGDTLLVADEMHNLGAESTFTHLPVEVNFRLGLSATPVRHYDEVGTQKLLEYFGPVVFQFTLEQAIGTCLTPYDYHPYLVELTDEEFEEFSRLTRLLNRFIDPKTGKLTSEEAKRLAIKRARVANNSVAKLEWLDQHISKYAELKHTLFYVGDALFDDTLALLGAEKKLRVHSFTSEESTAERKTILEHFSGGQYQGLVAMKCLDEGTDVPATRTAYFLASSGNPREFIQRRGRILRKYPGKDHATIYDLIAIPPLHLIDEGERGSDWQSARAAVRRELARVMEFAHLARNKYQAIDIVFDLALRLGISLPEHGISQDEEVS